MGTVFYDGLLREYRECHIDRWPWTVSEVEASKQQTYQRECNGSKQHDVTANKQTTGTAKVLKDLENSNLSANSLSCRPSPMPEQSGMTAQQHMTQTAAVEHGGESVSWWKEWHDQLAEAADAEEEFTAKCASPEIPFWGEEVRPGSKCDDDAEWTSVRARHGRAATTTISPGAIRASAAAAARRLVATWKTTPCGDTGLHDWRLCQHHHAGGKDAARRNPLAVCYLPGEAINRLEEMYHPMVFRTRWCSRGAACPFREPYVCAFAHSEEDLQQGMREPEYLALFGPQRATTARLGDFLDMHKVCPLASTEPSGPAASIWGESSAWPPRAPAAMLLPLTDFQEHLVLHSSEYWHRLTDTAGLNLCRLERLQSAATAGGEPAAAATLRVSGEQAEVGMVAQTLRDLLASPPEELVSCDAEDFSARVVTLVAEATRRLGDVAAAFGLGPRDGVLVEADPAAGRVTVRALRSRARPALGREVLGKIRAMVKLQDLDRFVPCTACGDDVNPDEGLACPGGHCFCSRRGDGDASCLAALMRSQLACLRAQQGALICPVCRLALPEQLVAAMAPPESWAAVQQAALDARVERRYAELESEFEQRLKAKVGDLMEHFGRGDVTDVVRMEGAAGAAKARDAALNLACPYCDAVYAEFDGCMALQCASCKRYFCGFCHKRATSSAGCHDHVRECDMNLTPNRSYFATAAQIREAQRRFRVKKLKHFLRTGGYKKDVQNSIVYHLSRELEDLGIDPAALFDVGNLQ